jgi:hypothetical protein
METKWTDIKKAPWLHKVAMVIDLVLNPKAIDWPIAMDRNGRETVFIRWVKRPHTK